MSICDYDRLSPRGRRTMTNKPKTRDEEIAGIIEGLWVSILDEQVQTHQVTQSQYRFCTVFLEHFAKEDHCECPAIDGPELRYFNDHVLRFLNGISLNSRERAYILSVLFERTFRSIARPHTSI